jgi:hypothetical protein
MASNFVSRGIKLGVALQQNGELLTFSGCQLVANWLPTAK